MRITKRRLLTTGRVLMLVALLALSGVLLIQRASAGSVDANGAFELGDGVDPLVPGVADVSGDPIQPGPDWNDLFNADRTLKDVYDEDGNLGSNGVADFFDTYGPLRARRDVGFIFDDVSAGTATDQSVMVGPGQVGAGSVSAAYDIGNAYAYGTFDAAKRLVLYAGVERLTASGGAVVFEFNKRLISVDANGQIVGDRSEGDLRLRAAFPGGVLTSVEVSKWTDVGWTEIEVLPIDPADPAEQCNPAGTICSVSNSANVDGGDWANYGGDGAVVTDLAPNAFVEMGLDLSGLLGIHTYDNYYSTRYASIQITTDDGAATPTPQDYALGAFMRAAKLAESRR